MFLLSCLLHLEYFAMLFTTRFWWSLKCHSQNLLVWENIFLGWFSVCHFSLEMPLVKESSQWNLRLYLAIFIITSLTCLLSGSVPILSVSLQPSHAPALPSHLHNGSLLLETAWLEPHAILTSEKKKVADFSSGIKHFLHCSPDHSLLNLHSPHPEDFPA